MADGRPLYVTKPSLPPLQELLPLLEEIWSSRILSNEGVYHNRFETALAEHLGVEHLSLTTNGTLGLLLALQQSKLKGQVITTPFSFIGTSHAIALSGLQPVFADIDPVSLTLDPSAVEAALTPETSAIMPVHIFGRPCDTEAFEALAKKHSLRLIYDAAHAFGVEDSGGSVLRHGDMSVLSLHATKVFNTFEGGAVICRDAATKQTVDELRNFGIIDELSVTDIGMNAKMHEFSAALGLLQFDYIEESTQLRADADERYRKLLASVPGVSCLPVMQQHKNNFYSFPVLVDHDAAFSAEELQERLRANNIFARRYFYPLISDQPMYRDLPSADPSRLSVARDVAQRILCLPLFPDLQDAEQQRIAEIMAS